VHHNEREAYRPLVTDESVEVQLFKTSGGLPIFLKESIPQLNKEKTERSQHVTGWTRKG
jgi:hypothetical protein